jgi:hypothetical protein
MTNGTLNESLVIAKISEKCDIKRDPKFDHEYKLDFVLDRFKNIAKMVPIGVQVTTRIGNGHKLETFLIERKKCSLVDRSLYIEIHPDTDIDAWGAELIYAGLISFAFQKDFKEKGIYGFRINPDVTCEFFDLETAIKSAQALPEIGSTINGRIWRWFDNQMGRIMDDAGNLWFVHHNNLSEQIKERFIPNILTDEKKTLLKPIYIEFENGGAGDGERKLPKAINVRLQRKNN